MKNLILFLIILLFQYWSLFAQNLTVTGKLVDQNNAALSGYTVKMYINPQVYTATSAANGTFTFNNVTDVGDEQIPSDYSISNNFPNPFNPTTRFEITLPNPGNVKVELFNPIGERVLQTLEKDFDAGKNYFDIEMNGLPNGVYLAKISIDEKYTVIKKLMLLYGSQHLSQSNSSTNDHLNKRTSNTPIDSVVVTWAVMGKKVFTGLPNLVNGTLNLGNLVVQQASISGKTVYAGTTIPVAGVTVEIDGITFTTGPDGLYQLNAISPGSKTLVATKSGYDPYSLTMTLIGGTNTKNIEMTSAQFTHNLYGTIVDSITLQPLSGVLIIVLNSDGTPSNLQTYSDFTGYYQIPTVPQGQRTVKFSKQNYITHSIQLFISNSNYQYNVGLQLFCAPSIVYFGKTYNIVQIGDQCWLKENLDVGTRINGSLPQTNNNIIEKYCYDDDPNNCNNFGGLYQWKEAMQYVTNAGTQGICPTGWHIPTNAEFQTLSSAVGGDGNALKEIGQGTGGGAGTNTSGFSAFLAGFRYWDGSFSYLDIYTYFQSSTQYNIDNAYFLHLKYFNNSINLLNNIKVSGYSVRCVKD